MILAWYELLFRKPLDWFNGRRRKNSLPLTNLDPKRSNAQNFELNRPFSPYHIDEDDDDDGNDGVGTDDKKHHGRFYAGGWAHLHREPSRPTKRESGSRWSRTKSMITGGGGAIGTAHGGTSQEELRAPPAAAGASGVARIVVRDPSNRSSGLRVETEDEALRRLRFGSAGDRESMVLGDETWPQVVGDKGEVWEDVDIGKGKGKAKTRSLLDNRKSWMGDGEATKRISVGSDTLGQPGPSGGSVQKGPFMNPLKMNPLSIVGPPKEDEPKENRTGPKAGGIAEEKSEERDAASVQEITRNG